MENEGGEANKGYSLIRVRRTVSTKPNLLDVSKLNNSRTEDDEEEKAEERGLFKCCQEFFRKVSRNFQITLAMFTSGFCYYFYIFWYFIPVMQNSKVGLDLRFYLFLDDSHYRTGFLYLLFFHYFFFWFVFSFVKVSMSSPGFIDKEYVRVFAVNNIYDEEDREKMLMKLVMQTVS